MRRQVTFTWLFSVLAVAAMPCFADTVTLAIDQGMEVTIVELPYVPEEHEDICPYFSTCETYVKSITVAHDGSEYKLPVSNPQIYDLRHGNTFYESCIEKDYCVFRAIAGRGATLGVMIEWLVLGENIVLSMIVSSYTVDGSSFAQNFKVRYYEAFPEE